MRLVLHNLCKWLEFCELYMQVHCGKNGWAIIGSCYGRAVHSSCDAHKVFMSCLQTAPHKTFPVAYIRELTCYAFHETLMKSEALLNMSDLLRIMKLICRWQSHNLGISTWTCAVYEASQTYDGYFVNLFARYRSFI